MLRLHQWTRQTSLPHGTYIRAGDCLEISSIVFMKNVTWINVSPHQRAIVVIGELEEITWWEAKHAAHASSILRPVRERSMLHSKMRRTRVHYRICEQNSLFVISKSKERLKLNVFPNLFGGKNWPDLIWMFYKFLWIQLRVFICFTAEILKYLIGYWIAPPMPEYYTRLSSYLSAISSPPPPNSEFWHL